MFKQFYLLLFFICLKANFLFSEEISVRLSNCLDPGNIKYKLRNWITSIDPNDLRLIKKHLGPYKSKDAQSVKLYELLFNIDMAGGPISDSINFNQLKEKFYYIKNLESKLKELNMYKEDFRDDIKLLLNNKNIGEKDNFMGRRDHFSLVDEYKYNAGELFDKIRSTLNDLEGNDSNPYFIDYEEFFQGLYYLDLKPIKLKKLYQENSQQFLNKIKKVAKECY